MRNPLVVVAALTLVACGGSDGETTVDTVPPVAMTETPSTDVPSTEPPPPSTVEVVPDPEPPPEIVDVFSADGELGLSYTSRPGGPSATVRLLEPDEWPAELASPANADTVKIFELEPDGAVFDEPVTVTRRLDISVFESLDLGPLDVPLVTMLTQDDAGGYEVLDDLSLVRVGPDLFVTGTTTHFSPIIVSNENRMIPWGPGEGDGTAVPTLADTYIDPDEFLEIMRGLIDAPPGQVIVEESRWLTGQELFEHVRNVIEGQESEGGSGEVGDFPGYELIDGSVILDRTPIDPQPVTPADGAYRAERFGTEFPTIPLSLLPGTRALVDDPNGVIALAVWVPALILQPDAVIVAEAAEPPTTAAPDDQKIADCLMYLEMYPELVEIDPRLAELCETDVDAAQAIISEQLFGDD